MQSTFAPQSTSSMLPSAVGSTGASAGRSTPLARRMMSVAPATVAPVLPAVRKTSPFPSATRFIPTTMEESFFVRMAFTGGSAISISSRASTTSIRSGSYSRPLRCSAMTSFFPTMQMEISSYSRRASNAPSIIARGALSPPIASKIIRIISVPSLFSVFPLRGKAPAEKDNPHLSIA